jgi:hypothetical protein
MGRSLGEFFKLEETMIPRSYGGPGGVRLGWKNGDDTLEKAVAPEHGPHGGRQNHL